MNYMMHVHEYVSTNVSLNPPTIAVGCASWSLKIDSITDNSVAVVSSPAKATQLEVRQFMDLNVYSFTQSPAPITSLPRFTDPHARGTCNNDDNSS